MQADDPKTFFFDGSKHGDGPTNLDVIIQDSTFQIHTSVLAYVMYS
jgi:hypothetical protein